MRTDTVFYYLFIYFLNKHEIKRNSNIHVEERGGKREVIRENDFKHSEKKEGK